MNLREIYTTAILPAYDRLPHRMRSPQATCMLLAIGLQESRFLYRRQLNDGPARGFWQFEQGTARTRGGVTGVLMHPASENLLRSICAARDTPATPSAIWHEIEHDDVLAAIVARLLLWTDPQPLPALGQELEAWNYYLRNWRPGKPHWETWPELYQTALNFVLKE